MRDLLKLEEGTLHRLASTLDPAAFDQAAAMLGGAGSIELCAAGSGLYLLEEFAFRLMKFGFRVNVISNSVNLSYIANQMDPTHCLLLLSYTGMNEAIGSAMRFARQHGTPVLLITGHADSPAARLSDCVLLLPLLESNDNKISTFSSTIAAKAMLDLLFARLFQNNYSANCDFVRRDAARWAFRTGSTALPTPAERMQKSPARGAVQGPPDGTFWERGVQPAALSSSEISGRVTTEKTVEKNTPLEM